MKIEIVNNDSLNVCGLEIHLNEKRIQNVNNKGFRQYEFCEEEIYFIIGKKNHKSYENGKYIFDVPKWILDIASGNGLKNSTTEQNKFSYNYSKI